MLKDKLLTNHEIVTLAVFLAGGDCQNVDTEDVAFKANEIAPGRFTWRKFPEQINIKNVGAFLTDARKPKNGSYLVGSEKKGWLLSESGLNFVNQHINSLSSTDLSRQKIDPKERKWRQSERVRLLASEAHIKVYANQSEAVTRREAESFFRIDDYVTGDARQQKIQRLKNIFGQDPDLGQKVIQLALQVEEKS